ncbi:MAG: methyltransferase domain-containing protein [Gemmatimonadetes bacterium]|nr:methyltransferase domain-containing protein [Gemmatimonadota bacterium]
MTITARFRAAYAEHRASEGRGSGGPAELLALPFLGSGPLAREWAVRARTYSRFMDAVVAARAREVSPRALSVLDLGAGNGWLCYRLTHEGHQALALDWRRDQVDGLGAAAAYQQHRSRRFPRLAASFEQIPIKDGQFDIAVFNAALHYTEDLERTLGEAVRVVRSGGRVVILDSPFYRQAVDGERMVAEKRQRMARALGAQAGALLGLKAIEYLTRDRLARASTSLALEWRRHRVWYPLWYELRSFSSWIRGRRPPSRFDIWEAVVA